MIHICDTQCAEGDCDAILIKGIILYYGTCDFLLLKVYQRKQIMIALLYVFTLSSLLIYDVTNLALKQFLKSKEVDQSV